jgi:hypothetical protein
MNKIIHKIFGWAIPKCDICGSYEKIHTELNDWDKILELRLEDSSIFQRDNVDLPIDKLPEVGFRLKPE